MIREEAIAVLESDAEYIYSQDTPYNREAYQMAVEALKAEPVKHGHWIMKWHTFYRVELPYCSACNKGATFKWDYCPNCGARMDLIGEDKSHPFAESVMMGMDGGEE